MRKYAVTLSFLGCLLLTPQVCIGKTWRGITPLISTRQDIDRILGKPVIDKNIYDTEDGRAIVYYSDGRPCEEGLPGLGNIPKNTVVQVYLSLKNEIKLSDLLSGGREYTQTRAVHTSHIYYTDKVEGVQYSSFEGLVSTITYFGASADEKAFSCGEYKYAAPVPTNPDPLRVEQYPFDSFGNIQLEDAQARLDNFAIQLTQSNKDARDYRGFIIVYGGPSSHVREPELVAECYRNYLVKTRDVVPKSLIAVAGGYKEEFAVELYIIPINGYPPVLVPTVSPKKVRIVKGRFKPCS